MDEPCMAFLIGFLSSFFESLLVPPTIRSMPMGGVLLGLLFVVAGLYVGRICILWIYPGV